MTDTALIKVDEAKHALAEALDLTTILEVKDRAQAAHAYASAKGAREAANYAKEIELRARRKAGEFLRDMEPNVGTRGQLVGPGIIGPPNTQGPIETAPTLADLGINYNQSSRWQTEASVPEETFEAYVTETVADGKELTANAVYGMAKKTQRRTERVERIQALSQVAGPLENMGRFPIIYVDPPWRYEHVKTENRAIENQYPTMLLDDICALPVSQVATDDAVLFLWATSPKLAEAMSVLEAWGFTYRTSMVWVKDKIGMGYYVRSRHELLLIATRGSVPVPEPAVRFDSVIEAPRTKHSVKPIEVYERIEVMYPEYKKIELFSRSPRAGWQAWGNEA